jgi:hypothetical protein
VTPPRKRNAPSWQKTGASFPSSPSTGEGPRGYAVSPYNFLHREHEVYYPTAAERDAAVAKLPYLASDRFVKQLKDTRKNAVFTYVRRPTYYATFNAASRSPRNSELGLGVIWSPKIGALMQSQTASKD